MLLLDEPCSALDPQSTQVIEDLIVKLRDDVAVVIVTHNLQQAYRIADHVAFMYLGDLVEYNSAIRALPRARQGSDQGVRERCVRLAPERCAVAALAACLGLLGAGVAGCSTTQEKAAAPAGRAENILKARAEREGGEEKRKSTAKGKKHGKHAKDSEGEK